MKKTFLLLLLTFGLSIQAFNKRFFNPITNLVVGVELLANKYSINKVAIQHAFNAFEKLKLSGQILNQRYLTIADFSKPSSEKRLFIIDINKMELVLQTLVAHGRNSGTLFAKSFSNKNESYQSSLGVYLTGNIYKGKHGISLQLSGIESGINDHAKQRAIVLHGANYVNNNIIKQQGYIGRSLGCPAVPLNEVKKIIQTIKGASLLYIYAPDNYYSKKSKLINEPSLFG